MPDEATINVYLIARTGGSGPKQGSTLFVFDPPAALPKGVAVDRAGNITFDANAPQQVSLKYRLQTKSLSWGANAYAVSFQPHGSQSNEDMLWVTAGMGKPTGPAAPPGIKDRIPNMNGPGESMSITIDRKDANRELYSYGLAVNLTESSSHAVTLVRDDPQIKNPPRSLDFNLIIAVAIGVLPGLLVGSLLTWRVMRNR